MLQGNCHATRNRAKRAPAKKEVPESERGGEVEKTPEPAKVDPKSPCTKNTGKAPEKSETNGKGKAHLPSLKSFGECNNEVTISAGTSSSYAH
ncbi:hypothetical protein DAPPUDRAFT_238808 [Daphnia pulex]|uniref:Uncharacterized protein n=1 Tax=Daphnia pulex TaxID=6669 RepID=E9G7G3_DAPPU|nr:hypothetical protein DAPPUDRAFT_238808 [Daphnia pulex]|eukprot:EFX84646.1 hypothetical protein DAPPUDRAFT_238808 [Daphnia pulex]